MKVLEEEFRGIILKNSWMPRDEERISLYAFGRDDLEFLIEKNEYERNLKLNYGDIVSVFGKLEEKKDPFGYPGGDRKVLWVSQVRRT